MEAKTMSYICPYCHTRYQSQKWLQNHIEIKHKSDKELEKLVKLIFEKNLGSTIDDKEELEKYGIGKEEINQLLEWSMKRANSDIDFLSEDTKKAKEFFEQMSIDFEKWHNENIKKFGEIPTDNPTELESFDEWKNKHEVCSEIPIISQVTCTEVIYNTKENNENKGEMEIFKDFEKWYQYFKRNEFFKE